MPVYRLKQKFWLWDSDYFVQDESGKKNLYKLNRCALSAHSAVRVCDAADGEEVLLFRRTPFAWGTCFELKRNNMVLAKVQRKLIWFQRKYVLTLESSSDDESPVEYMIDTSKWKGKKNLTVHQNGEAIATVQRRAVSSTTFYVDITGIDEAYYEGDAYEEMSLIILSACIIVLQLLYSDEAKLAAAEAEKQRKEKVDNMPLQIVHD